MKAIRVTCLILATLASVTCASAVLGRRIEAWDYERLLRESDLVVIASLRSESTVDRRPPDSFGQLPVVAKIATLDVRSTLKGESATSVNVLHYLLTAGTVTANGPMLIHFDGEGQAVDVAKGDSSTTKISVKQDKPEYIIYLRRSENGAFEPTSGQYDARLAVRALNVLLE